MMEALPGSPLVQVLASAAVALIVGFGGMMLKLRGAGFSELKDFCHTLSDRLDKVDAARLLAEQRAVAAEMRAASAEAARLRDKAQADRHIAELREELHVLRGQLQAAGVTPWRRGAKDAEPGAGA